MYIQYTVTTFLISEKDIRKGGQNLAHSEDLDQYLDSKQN